MDYFKTIPFWKRPSIPQKPVCVGLGCALQHEQGPKTRRPITGNLYRVGTEWVWSYGGEAINIALNPCQIHI